MHDRGAFWPPVPDWPTAVLEGRGLRVAPARGIVAIHLVSGRVGVALEALGAPPPLGPRDLCCGERYALRLAPDRILVVSSRVEALAPGWTTGGYAVSDLTEGLLPIDVTGSGAGEILAEGTGYDFGATDARPAESATMLFAGVRLAIARRPDGYRLHVERPLATGLWTWLSAAIEQRRLG